MSLRTESIRMLALVGLFVLAGPSRGIAEPAAAEIQEVRRSCDRSFCPDHDAIFFVHGIFGDKDTFRNGEFDWPSRIPETIAGQTIDIYKINYTTHMFAWLDKDIASLDEVVDAVFAGLQGSDPFINGKVHHYRSVGFITHSLGGNVIAAYLHSVKSELGHADRARHGFLITLGAPVNGSAVANFGGFVKQHILMRDKLLTSLEKDNTFLRMMTVWRKAEHRKEIRFDCRPVNLYAAAEGAPLYGTIIVPKDSAQTPIEGLAREIKLFESYNHEQISKPASETDPVYVWVNDILTREEKRLNEWGRQPLCRQNYNPPT